MFNRVTIFSRQDLLEPLNEATVDDKEGLMGYRFVSNQENV